MYQSGKKYETMVGIGCGIENVHAKQVPIDAVRFIYKASELREVRTGALVIADLAVSSGRAEYRRKILEQIAIHTKSQGSKDQADWDIVLQSQMPRAEVNEVRINNRIIDSEDREYAVEEVRDVRLILERFHGTKFGWVLGEVRDRSGQIDPKRSFGGELPFDQEIENNYPKEYMFTYTGVIGVPISAEKGKNKCPYVVKNSEIEQRLCIVTPEMLDHEVEKLERALNERTKQANKAVMAAQEFAQIILEIKSKEVSRDSLPRLFREAQEAINS